MFKKILKGVAIFSIFFLCIAYFSMNSTEGARDLASVENQDVSYYSGVRYTNLTPGSHYYLQP